MISSGGKYSILPLVEAKVLSHTYTHTFAKENIRINQKPMYLKLKGKWEGREWHLALSVPFCFDLIMNEEVLNSARS